jgi:hypothetical protein
MPGDASRRPTPRFFAAEAERMIGHYSSCGKARDDAAAIRL